MALEQTFANVGLNPSDFTPGELTAIEEEIAEGASVSAAVHQCAPTKSRSDVFTGGNYHWSRNSDGTFNLFDVPVFAKHVRKLGMKLVLGKDGEPKVEENVVNVDEAWLSRAITINRSRLESGKYLGALHVRHHPNRDGEQDRTEPAGNFVLKYVRPMLYDGTQVPVLYADFVKIPAAIFERIKAGLLPYRSIESLPPTFEEIDSIALLDTETPWFRLPMLTPGEEIQREVYAATCPPVGSPLRGVAKGGKSRTMLCYFAGGSYEEKPDDTKEKPKGGDEDSGEEREMGEGEEGDEKNSMDGSGKGPIQCEVCSLTHPNDGRHEDESENAELNEDGEGDIMGKVLEALLAIGRGQEDILKAIGTKPPVMANKEAPVSEQDAKPSSLQSKASEGRLAAVEQITADLKREKDVKALVAKAMSDLCEYNLGSGAEAKLLGKAMASKEPEQTCKDYVDTIKEHGTPMPRHYQGPRPGSPEVPAFVPPPTESLPESVRSYVAKGAEVLEKAIAAQKMYLLCREQGSVGSLSEAEFIKHRVEPGYAVLKG